jgi:signal transduction histidine kinase
MTMALTVCAEQTALVAALLAEKSRRREAERALATSEAARRSSEREAQTLAGRLILSQESERRRIARDLHDNLSQKLALLCMDIDRLAAGASVAALAEAVAHLSERAGDIAGDVHRLSHDLHPPKLEILGLVPAIQSVCRDLSRLSNLQIVFRSATGGRRVPADVALCLFRISQEALQNVVKHSGATAATVRLRTTQSGICLHIADGGKGFCQTSIGGSGLGLLSMRERVRFAGGRIAIRSTAGHRGTHVVVNLPIDQNVSEMAQVAPITGDGGWGISRTDAKNSPAGVTIASLQFGESRPQGRVGPIHALGSLVARRRRVERQPQGLDTPATCASYQHD